MTLTLFCYVTLTSDDLETTSKQMAGHMLVRNDTLFVIVHHLFQMLCTNPEAYVGWRTFWICMKIGHLPWRDFWGFSIVGRYGTNELISGRNPLLQFCPTSVYISSFVYPTKGGFHKSYQRTYMTGNARGKEKEDNICPNNTKNYFILRS